MNTRNSILCVFLFSLLIVLAALVILFKVPMPRKIEIPMSAYEVNNK